MLKIRNQKELVSQSSKSINQEMYIQDILGMMLSQQVKLRYKSEISEISKEDLKKYYVIEDTQGILIGLDFSSLLEIGDYLQYFMLLVNYSNGIRDRDFIFVDPETVKEPVFVTVYEATDSSGKTGEIKVLLPRNLSLFYSGEISETKASGNPDHEKLSFRLGDIQIDVNSFLRLKEGMQIECDIPEEFKSELKIGEDAFASVTASIQNNKLRLTVNNLQGTTAEVN